MKIYLNLIGIEPMSMKVQGVGMKIIQHEFIVAEKDRQL